MLALSPQSCPQGSVVSDASPPACSSQLSLSVITASRITRVVFLCCWYQKTIFSTSWVMTNFEGGMLSFFRFHLFLFKMAQYAKRCPFFLNSCYKAVSGPDKASKTGLYAYSTILTEIFIAGSHVNSAALLICVCACPHGCATLISV